jgi:hypothetical protein
MKQAGDSHNSRTRHHLRLSTKFSKFKLEILMKLFFHRGE